MTDEEKAKAEAEAKAKAKESGDIQNQDGGKKEDDKKSTKTFTQSEFDSKTSEFERSVKEKYSDYDELKKKNEDLEKEKKDRELAEMSEVEKAKKISEDLEAKNKELEIKNHDLLIKELRNEVLSTEEYSVLPSIYKEKVEGDTVELIKESAKKIMERYTNDMKDKGKDVAIPKNLEKKDKTDGRPLTAVQKIVARIAGKQEGKII